MWGAFGPVDSLADDASWGAGSQLSTFHWPSALRTRFRLGCESSSVPSSSLPANSAFQRKPATTLSARKKYSRPKRGSSLMVTLCAIIPGVGNQRRSKKLTSTVLPNACSIRAVKNLCARLDAITRANTIPVTYQQGTKMSRPAIHRLVRFICMISLQKKIARNPL